MGTYSATKRSAQTSAPPLVRALIAMVGGVVLFLLGLGALAAGYEMQYAGLIMPGVSMAGQDLSGLTPEDAAARISTAVTFPNTGRIVFQDAESIWVAHPVELGLYLDAPNSAQAAYSLGRSGSLVGRAFAQFKAWKYGYDLPPLLVYDERVAQEYLENLAFQVDRPMIEASLRLDGINVVSTPGQIGRVVDINASLEPLEGQLRSLTDGILPLVVDEQAPSILDVSLATEQAQAILSAPLVLSVPDSGEGGPGPWTLEPERLARLLVFERFAGAEGESLRVRLDQEGLRTFIQAIGPAVSRTSANARFIFNDETAQLEVIQPAVIGRSLDVEATLQAVQEGLPQGQHNISLALFEQPPEVTDNATAEELGIRDLVSSQISYFYGSSASRIHNIETAAAKFHGVLVPPGGVFSMADTMGDVSLDNGYAEALIIYGDRTIEGVGGGVCQVSTTLFRTVFFGGFPVLERHSHAYRVYYYELNAANQVVTDWAGLDATVYVPVVDFKFKNDTPNWLLMETYTNPAARTLTWKFYSTSDGRSVDWDTTGLMNVVEPPDPVYQENPDLAEGEIDQVDWGVAGADVTVTRTVLRNGEVYFDDTFSTHYMPWRDVYEYGPGTKIPKQDKGD